MLKYCTTPPTSSKPQNPKTPKPRGTGLVCQCLYFCKLIQTLELENTAKATLGQEDSSSELCFQVHSVKRFSSRFLDF